MGYSGPRVPNPSSGNNAIWPYGYIPSLALGIVGIITFFFVASPQLWWLLKKRGTRSVHGLFFFAAIIEVLGYAARLSSHDYPFNGMSFLIGIYLIQIATILITAALYKAVQRGIKYTPDGRTLSPMRPRSMLTLFVILDVVWVLMQIGGQWLVAGAESAEVTGDEAMFAIGTSQLIFLAGNVLQAITILIFLALLLVIMRRSTRLLARADPNSGVQYPHLKALWMQIAISVGLFFVRLVMRIAEGAQGSFSYSGTREVFFGVFEFAPILLILIIWAARPLYKSIFPLGHRHGEGAHVREFGTAAGSTTAHHDGVHHHDHHDQSRDHAGLAAAGQVGDGEVAGMKRHELGHEIKA